LEIAVAKLKKSKPLKVSDKARIYGGMRSRPGDPPFKQTGHLRRSIAWEINGIVGRVGTNLDYGRFLELGTRRMAARPWLRRSLLEKQAEIQKILGVGTQS